MSYSSAGGLLAAAGRRVKNPEGPLTLKRFPIAGAGKCLLLYYFNSCPGYACPGVKRSARNPYWLSAAWEEPGASGGPGAAAEVRLSQPEVVLYDASAAMMASGTAAGYPDFIETAAGGVWVTETNKTHARSHRRVAGGRSCSPHTHTRTHVTHPFFWQARRAVPHRPVCV